MANPYTAPTAALGDPPGPAPLPRAVSVLRALALGANGVIALLAMSDLVLLSSRPPMLILFVAGVYLVCGTTIVALATRFAERPVRWSAMLLNAAVTAFIVYAAVATAAKVTVLLVALPGILNMVAIEALRRARARLA